MEKDESGEALKANASVLEELVFKYTLISLLSELDGLLREQHFSRQHIYF